MTSQDDAVRRSLGALTAHATEEHPGAEALEAYVEGRLSTEERASIDRLAASSSIVAEDIADLQSIRQALVLREGGGDAVATSRVEGRRDVRWARTAAIAAVAASLVMAIWVSQRRSTTVNDAPAEESILTSAERASVASAIRDGRIVLPDALAALNRPPSPLLGDAPPARFGLQGPLATEVLSTTPTFTWDDTAADAYTVAIFDEQFSEVARGRVTGTSWQSTTPLRRGVTYLWQVTAHRGSVDETEPKPPRSEARFAIVDDRTAARIADLQTRLADDPLSLGILLAEEGLIADARLQLRRAAAPPLANAVAGRLLDSLDQGTPITTKPAQ